MKTVVVKLRLEEMLPFLDSGSQTEGPVRPGRVENHVGAVFPSHVGLFEQIDYQEKPLVLKRLDAAVQFRIHEVLSVLFEIDIRFDIPVPLEQQFKIAAGSGEGNYQ